MSDKDKLDERVSALRDKVKALSPEEKIALASRLGISYFTLMGKVCRFGNFSATQIESAENWFGDE